MSSGSLAGDVGHDALGFADADVDGRLAEMERHELPVDIGHVDERDVAETFEFQQSSCGEACPARPRGRAGPSRRSVDAPAAACRNSRLEIIASRLVRQRGRKACRCSAARITCEFFDMTDLEQSPAPLRLPGWPSSADVDRLLGLVDGAVVVDPSELERAGLRRLARRTTDRDWRKSTGCQSAAKDLLAVELGGERLMILRGIALPSASLRWPVSISCQMSVLTSIDLAGLGLGRHAHARGGIVPSSIPRRLLLLVRSGRRTSRRSRRW